MTPSVVDHVLRSLGLPSPSHSQHIQNLWSGYGSLDRLVFEDRSLILKEIRFPNEQHHPRGWNSDLSHQRKVRSYQVETRWYQSYNDVIPGAPTAKHLLSGEVGELRFLVLEDLQAQGYTPLNSPSENQVKACLHWLGHFHGHYLDHAPEGLWEVGTYWHLQTRPEELERLQDLELKEAAPLIDQRLSSAKNQGLVHGDAKLANFLFKETDAAAVDFQYVGGGVGIKDVAYFLSSVYEEDELFEKESHCLDCYFIALREVLISKGHPDPIGVEQEWRDLYPLAWCDFYRFLQGWSPGHWKIHSYSESMKSRALACL